MNSIFFPSFEKASRQDRMSFFSSRPFGIFKKITTRLRCAALRLLGINCHSSTFLKFDPHVVSLHLQNTGERNDVLALLLF
jgi:hypothetical protein